MGKFEKCPFCGGDGGLIGYRNPGYPPRWVPCCIGTEPGALNGCGAHLGNYYSESDAINAWNSRASRDDPPKPPAG